MMTSRQEPNIMKIEYLFKALNSFTENLLAIDYSQKENLYYIVLSSILDFMKASRASYLRFEQDEQILYNKKTLLFRNGIPVFDEMDIKLKHVTIDITNDYRNKFLSDMRYDFLVDVKTQSDLSQIFDTALGIKPEHMLIYPLYFQDDFIGLIEVTREIHEGAFDEVEKGYFATLLNFVSAMLSNMYLYEWAIRDYLTDCYAITYFNRLFDEAITTTKRYNEPFSIFMLDIDNFKNINDTYGHKAGDQALVFFANAIQNFIRREIDILARYGGDEFCLLLKKCTIKHASIIAGRIIEYLSNENFEIDNNIINFTTSIGIAQYDMHGTDRETLFKKADLALYKSKDKGKNCFTLYSPELDESDKNN